jgi:NitT/TauT family transport system permease protein
MKAQSFMRALDYALLTLGFYVIWLAVYYFSGPDAVSAPGETFQRALAFLGSAEFWRNAAGTGIAFGYACLIALVGGLLVGVAIGSSLLATEVGEPMLGTLYSIPKITLYPVILLVFGLGMPAKVAFGALHGIFPVILFTLGAIKNTRDVYLRTASVLRLTRMQRAWTILVPAALPEIVTGLRIGFSTTLLGTLIGELFASDRGIGFILIRAMEANQVRDIMALTLLLFAFAVTVNTVLLAAEHRMQRK